MPGERSRMVAGPDHRLLVTCHGRTGAIIVVDGALSVSCSSPPAAQVIVISLGENLVGTSAPLPAQLFTIVFALAGLVSFALVLALVEQVILSLVQDNVTTGPAAAEGLRVRCSWN